MEVSSPASRALQYAQNKTNDEVKAGRIKEGQEAAAYQKKIYDQEMLAHEHRVNERMREEMVNYLPEDFYDERDED